ncbi:MAG: Holliday junction branch migration protein RuvA [Proteobacteria bacterium]|jgi:holliday junction DNA helicase RuvA|nr:Holliday junction branch migration protein RuvA [Pseudomonadota bacterium]
MIAMLTGELHNFQGNRGIIDVRGVGYEVFATQTAFDSWTGEESVTVWVSTQVREGSFQLYGFEEMSSRDAFETLLSVSGVGPKMALATLDTLSPSALAQAVATDDVVTLSRVPGVGKKTAQRLALELKGKLSDGFQTPTTRTSTASRTPADPLPLALARLGYTKSEIDRAQQGLRAEGISSDTDISSRLRAALKVLSRNQ